MVTSPKSKDAQEDLNQRLRSLKIDRGTAPAPAAGNRSPKLLLLAIAVLVAAVALGFLFVFFFLSHPAADGGRGGGVEWGGGAVGRRECSVSVRLRRGPSQDRGGR